jgi:hypothetical protein
VTEQVDRSHVNALAMHGIRKAMAYMLIKVEHGSYTAPIASVIRVISASMYRRLCL